MRMSIQLMKVSHQLHKDAIFYVMGYLKGALGKGLLPRTSNLAIIRYADANWTGDPLARSLISH